MVGLVSLNIAGRRIQWRTKPMPFSVSLSISSGTIAASGVWTSRALIPRSILGVETNEHEAALVVFIICGELAKRYGHTPVESDGPQDETFRALRAAAHPNTEAVRTSWEVGDQPFTAEIELCCEDNGYRLRWRFDSSTFSSGDVMRRDEHFHILLADAIAHPDCPVSRLNILPEWESDLVIRQWNETTTNYPRQSSVTVLLRDIVEKFPTKVAVEDGATQLTYEALWKKAHALALVLRQKGVEHGDRVGVSMNRGIGLIVTMLGILQAGAAFVPLDKNYPRERLEFLVKDATLALVLADGDVAALTGISCPVLVLETISAGTTMGSKGEPCETALPGCAPDDVALVMYTSGTTGKPKGVLVPHRAVVRLVRDTDYVQFGADDVVGQIANTSFDAITFEVFGALLNGGRLVIFRDNDVLSPRRFRAATHGWGVTKMFVTAALFDVIVRAEPDAFSHMDTLVVGGDALNVRTIRQLLASAPPRRLVNGYGPTEATTFSVCHEIQRVPEDATSIPIGRPISNSTAYVLDRHLRPTPIGVQGELYLGGDGVALGYLNRPELTAARFPADPFGGEASENARLYKTGDLARWTHDGVIEFFGRTDHQVKFNGFRIELGEIETALRQHPAVADALVVMRTDTAGFKTLAAYIVPVPGTKPEPESSWGSEIRQWLAGRIPAFMLPNTIVLVSAFPLTSRGKVDREALPDPQACRPTVSVQADSVPEDTPEARVRLTWKEVLHLENVGLDTSFFELGGTSIKLALVEEQLQRRWGYEVTATDLFRFPTVRSLAVHLRGGASEQPVRDEATGLRATRQRAAFARRSGRSPISSAAAAN